MVEGMPVPGLLIESSTRAYTWQVMKSVNTARVLELVGSILANVKGSSSLSRVIG